MSKKILLVDDAKLFLEVEKSLFQRTGAKIFTASSGAEALKVALTEKPDIVLLDFMLPDFNGDKVCSQLKSNPLTSGTPVVMVTTMGKPEDVERCRRAGCDDFVTKPLHHQELLSKVSQLLKIPHRQSFRILVRLEAQLGKDGEVFFGNSVDVSKGGMLLECGRELKEDFEIQLRFFLPGQKEVSVVGQVVRTEKVVFHKFRYGIQFKDLTPQDQKAIADFVAHRTENRLIG